MTTLSTAVSIVWIIIHVGVVSASIVGIFRNSRERCTCCTNGDSCDCTSHCARHCKSLPLPRARALRAKVVVR